jgi:hypothetical protein
MFGLKINLVRRSRFREFWSLFAQYGTGSLPSYDPNVRPGAPIRMVRALRAGIAQRRTVWRLRKPDRMQGRHRRGHLTLIPQPWRRCAMGTNRISCMGVWRRGTRRQALRSNRTGETEWHRLRRVFDVMHPHCVGDLA